MLVILYGVQVASLSATILTVVSLKSLDVLPPDDKVPQPDTMAGSLTYSLDASVGKHAGTTLSLKTTSRESRSRAISLLVGFDV